MLLSPSAQTVPHALLHNLKHNKVLHAQNLFVSVQQADVPWVGLISGPAWSRWVTRVGRSRCGLVKNEPDLPKALALVKTPGLAD